LKEWFEYDCEIPLENENMSQAFYASSRILTDSSLAYAYLVSKKHLEKSALIVNFKKYKKEQYLKSVKVYGDVYEQKYFTLNFPEVISVDEHFNLYNSRVSERAGLVKTSPL
jgi:hypothetical protein